MMEGIAINQLLVLILQCVIVGSLILFLFRLRFIFGLSLLFTALGVFQYLQTFLVAAIYIEISPGVVVSPGSMVLFTGSLFAILLIYIREDAIEARKVIYALLTANLVLVVLQLTFSWSMMGQYVINIYNLPKEFFIINSRVLLAGTIVLFFDAFVIIFIYEIVSRYISSLFFRIFFSMAIVVSIDSLLFSLGAFAGTALFSKTLFSGLIAKLFSTVIYSIIFWGYLMLIDKKVLKLDINSKPFNDIFHTLTYRQKYEQVSLEKLNKSIELQKSEIRFKTLFDYMVHGVTCQNAVGEIIDANPAAERILGLTLQQMQGKSFIDFNWKAIHEDGSEFKGENHASMVALKTGKPVKNVIMGVFNSNSNDYCWLKVNATPQFRNSEKNAYQVFTTFEDITNERFSQSKLNELHTKYQSIIHTANIGIVELNKKGNYTFVNPAWEAMFGYKNSEVLGKHKELILPNDQPTNLLFNELIHGKISNYQIKRKYQTKNGEAVWVDSYIAANTDMHGNLNSIVGVMIDITDGKQAIDDLKDSEIKLKQLLNSLESGIVVHAPDTSIIYHNHRATEILNSRYDQLIGKHVFDHPWNFLNKDASILPSEDYPINLILRKKEAIKNMVMGIAHFETITWVLINGLPILNEASEIKEVIISFIDITEQKRKEDELKTSEQRFRTIVEGAPDPIFIQSNKCFVYLNKLAVELFGAKDEKELLGKPVLDYFHPDFHKKALERIKKLNIDKKMVHDPFEQILIQLNGNEIWVETKGEPIFYNGEYGGLVFIRNITTRKIAESKMDEYKKSLQKLTTELMLAEEKQRKEIAANIHDHLSQSLVISKMKLNDLWNQMETNDKQNDIGTVIKHISEALENTRKITYDLSPPVLYELGLIEAIYWLAEKIENQNQINVTFETDFNEIKLSEPKLILVYRAIQEILNNAIKHSGANQIHIRFTKYEYGLEIIITDKGKGFDKSLINSRVPLSSGFGLFTVRERIENLQGKFIINSKLGFGTEVKIFVPLKANKLL